MNPRQKRFVSEYLIDFNGTQAAIRAGYSAKTARSIAQENLTKPDIARAVEEARKQIAERCELTAQRVLDEIGRLAFSDLRSFFNEEGNLKPLSELTAAQGAQLAGVEVIVKNAVAGDGVVDRIHKIKLWPKDRALELAAKYFGLLTEKVEHSGQISSEAKALADVFSSEELLAIRERLRSRSTDQPGASGTGAASQAAQ